MIPAGSGGFGAPGKTGERALQAASASSLWPPREARPPPCRVVPLGNLTNRRPTLAELRPTPRGRHGLVPARWSEIGGQVGQGCQNEEAISGAGVRDREPLRGGGGRDVGGGREVGAGREVVTGRVVGASAIAAARLRRTLRVDRVAAEDEEVEVERSRPPAWAVAPPERTLEPFERDQQRERPGHGIRAARDVDRHDGVAKLGLVSEADRRRGVEPRHTLEPHSR